jgi:ComEC/Rec2-related protein
MGRREVRGMVWVLAAALAAGVTGDLRIAAGAVFVFAYVVGTGRWAKGRAASLVLVGALYFLHAHISMGALRRDISRVSEQAASRPGAITLVGWVCGFPYYRVGGRVFAFRTRIEGVECTVLVRSKEFDVDYGDSLRITGGWKVPRDGLRDSERRLVGMGVCGDFRAGAGAVERGSGCAGNWITRRILAPCHERIREELSRGLGSRCGLPIAVLLGETGYLDRRSSSAFTAFGITHLIALSGQHLYFIAGFVLILLRIVRRRSGAALLAAIWAYVAVVGFIVSLWRAFVMVVVLGLASAVKRRLDPVRALADAFVVVLLFYPFTYYSVGFQLSFLATLALLLCVRGIEPPESMAWRARFAFSIRSSVLVSIAAQLIVLPVIIHYFDRVSLFSPIATLIYVVPVAFVLLYSGFAAVLSLVIPASGSLTYPILDRSVVVLERSLVTAAGFLPGTVSLPEPNGWVYYAGLGILAFSSRGQRRTMLGWMLMGASFFSDSIARQLF